MSTIEVQPNELTPGIPSEEYERRRKSLMDSLPEDSIVISVAAPIKYMSNSESTGFCVEISDPDLNHLDIL